MDWQEGEPLERQMAQKRHVGSVCAQAAIDASHQQKCGSQLGRSG